jgi:hypothetical protein
MKVAVKDVASKRVDILQAVCVDDHPADSFTHFFQEVEELMGGTAVEIPCELQLQDVFASTKTDPEIRGHALSFPANVRNKNMRNVERNTTYAVSTSGNISENCVLFHFNCPWSFVLNLPGKFPVYPGRDPKGWEGNELKQGFGSAVRAVRIRGGQIVPGWTKMRRGSLVHLHRNKCPKPATTERGPPLLCRT